VVHLSAGDANLLAITGVALSKRHQSLVCDDASHSLIMLECTAGNRFLFVPPHGQVTDGRACSKNAELAFISGSGQW
jgi:hypothetical protein